MTDRERLHDLVEDLPESEVHAALRFIEYLRRSENDPVLAALRDARPDDEPLTEEDVAALEEAYEDLAQGRVVAHEEARRRLLGED
jgi:predicted transcriptional regulator